MALTVLVTGATAGFGQAIARRFVRDGHRVIATGRRAERLDRLRGELGDRLLPFALDVTDRGAVTALPGTGVKFRNRAVVVWALEWLPAASPKKICVGIVSETLLSSVQVRPS